MQLELITMTEEIRSKAEDTNFVFDNLLELVELGKICNEIVENAKTRAKETETDLENEAYVIKVVERAKYVPVDMPTILTKYPPQNYPALYTVSVNTKEAETAFPEGMFPELYTSHIDPDKVLQVEGLSDYSSVVDYGITNKASEIITEEGLLEKKSTFAATIKAKG